MRKGLSQNYAASNAGRELLSLARGRNEGVGASEDFCTAGADTGRGCGDGEKRG